VDYQDTRSALAFARSYGPSLIQPASVLGPGWRHNYELKLARHGMNRHLYLANGRRLTFEPIELTPISEYNKGHQQLIGAADQSIQPIRIYATSDASSGILYEMEHGHVWRAPNGWRYQFHGAYLVEMRHPLGEKLSIYYKNNRIASITDQYARQLVFHYYRDRLRQLMLPDGRSLLFTYGLSDELHEFQSVTGSSVQYQYRERNEFTTAASLASECLWDQTSLDEPSLTDNTSQNLEQPLSEPRQPDQTVVRPLQPQLQPEQDACNSDENPPTNDFISTVSIPDAIKVDARPASCASYFVDFIGIERGREIEDGFELHDRYEHGQTTVRTFPIVDFLIGDEAILSKYSEMDRTFMTNS